MHLEIITPDKKVFAGEANAVTFPGTEGQFQVLNNHAPLVSTLGVGDVVVETAAAAKQTYRIDGGVVEVLKNKVLVLAEAII
jgi:F-type H+-transporting ATPase subunit epsilon